VVRRITCLGSQRHERSDTGRLERRMHGTPSPLGTIGNVSSCLVRGRSISDHHA